MSAGPRGVSNVSRAGLSLLLAVVASSGCATTGGQDHNAVQTDPCDCGDEKQWDQPPPAPGQYTPEADPGDKKGDGPGEDA